MSFIGRAVVFVLATIALSGCWSESDDSTPVKVTLVAGFVMADDPVVGATIRIEDNFGRTIPASTDVKSQASGTFAYPAQALPKSYTVIASGGTWQGRPFQGSLRYQVLDSNREKNVVYVTPVSTVAAALQRQHGFSLAQIDRETARFLRLSSLDLDAFKRHSALGFSAREFMRQASAGGGIDRFVDALMNDSLRGATHGFVEQAPFSLAQDQGPSSAKLDAGTVAPILQWAAIELSNAAGQDQFTSFLTSFGPALVPARLSQIQQRMDVLASQVAQLQSSIDGLSSNIKCDFAQSGYQTAIGQATTVLSAVENGVKLMDTVISHPSTDPQYQSLTQVVMDVVRTNPSMHTEIKNRSAGNSSTTYSSGAIALFSKSLVDCGVFFNPQKSQMVANQFRFWVSTQVAACQLVMSYQKAIGFPVGSTAADCNTWIQNLTSGPIAVTAVLAPDSKTVLDTRTNLLFKYIGQITAEVENGVAYVNFGPYERANLGYYVPTDQELARFLTGFANRTESVTRNGLANAGWGDFDAQTGTTQAYSGTDSMWFWVSQLAPRLWLSQNFRPAAMSWNGIGGGDCACSGLLLMVADPAGATYYVK